MRPFSEVAYLSLKRAVEVAYSLAGGVSLFALTTRVRVSTLSKYASDGADNLDTCMPIDVAIDLDRAARQPVVTAKMAELLGYDLVPRVPPAGASRRVVDGDAVDFMVEAMDVVRAIQAALADGRVSRDDARKVMAELSDLQREIDDLKRNIGEG
ncbi:hypothetical protein [Rhizobium sp. CSW-27]|uniref:hypothetical protein n=1 Tax=Rhizobium sp. CSW-27 TaxID=2839985 RepID=UPI001C01A63F|nr:hypothetical protein [Rhizobium sp. CSW-27]MBT9373206.1 hypothetical protein [Rhizobium sp. CSW-27]